MGEAKIYTGPEPGVKASWNKREIYQELADILDFNERPDKLDYGAMRYENMAKIGKALNIDIDKHQRKQKINLLNQIRETAGIEKKNRNKLDKDDYWNIMQKVKNQLEKTPVEWGKKTGTGCVWHLLNKDQKTICGNKVQIGKTKDFKGIQDKPPLGKICKGCRNTYTADNNHR
jgi:hypothetical protein